MKMMSHDLIVQMVYSYVQIRCLQVEFYSAKNIAQNAIAFATCTYSAQFLNVRDNN